MPNNEPECTGCSWSRNKTGWRKQEINKHAEIGFKQIASGF